MDPFFHTGLSISDSLKTVRKSVLIYETIIVIRFWGKDIKKNLEECVQVVEETVFEVKMSWDEYEE